MDMGQFYTPLSIGTAKPSLHTLPFACHLFDSIDTPSSLTVVEYAQRLQATVSCLPETTAAVVVGGSMFYLKSLFFPPHMRSAGSVQVRDLQVIDKAPHELWQLLYSIDPQRAHALDPQDTYRITRALDIWHTTGQKPSACKPEFAPLFPSCTILYVTRDRQDMYARINARVQTMIELGWVDEVAALRGTAWEDFLREKKIIGYAQLFEYFRLYPRLSLEEVIAQIQQKTRNYAKRQESFWKSFKVLLDETPPTARANLAVHELNLTPIDSDLYINQLLTLVKKSY